MSRSWALGALLSCLVIGCGSSDDDPATDSGTFSPVDAALVPDGSVSDAAPPPDAPVPDPAHVCDEDIACPAPVSAKVTVCGRLVDIDVGVRVYDNDATGALCNPAAPTATGPCSLELRHYDALAFAANPAATAPLSAAEIAIDDCGRFRSVSVTPPFNGYLGVVADDAAAASSDGHVPTIVVMSIDPGETRRSVEAMFTTHAVDEAWSGSSLYSELGVIAMVYTHAGVRINGVVPTASGTLHGGDSKGPGKPTLVTDSPLSSHSGSGNEPKGCVWERELGAAVPGAYWFAERRAVVEGTDEPCP